MPLTCFTFLLAGIPRHQFSLRSISPVAIFFSPAQVAACLFLSLGEVLVWLEAVLSHSTQDRKPPEGKARS